MKKIAFITDGWERYVTYAWIHGYRRYMSEHPLTDIDLYVFHSFGNFSQRPEFQYRANIISSGFRICLTFDGIHSGSCSHS